MARHHVPERVQVLERDRIDLRIALAGEPRRHRHDADRRQQEEQDRDRPADRDDALRHQTFTNLRKSTLRIRPMAMKNIIVADPPYEISGRGIPVTGKRPICIETLMRMW